MEDVVLHYRSDSAPALRSLLDSTEKLLERFPRRPPPAFTPWFPPAADRWLPIRPRRAAPVITSASIQETTEEAETQRDSSACEEPAGHSAQTLEKHQDGRLSSDSRPEALMTKLSRQNKAGKPEDGELAAERQTESDTRAEKLQELTHGAAEHLPPASLCGEAESAEPRTEHQPQKESGDSEVRRSWSVFAQKGIMVHGSMSLSKQFHKTVWKHRLNLRQRAKWVISQSNCGASRDIEQVWRAVSRAIRSSRLPTCNGNIRRPQVEIWLFCDLLYSELVGKFLKEELRLSGSISLSVHRLGNIFSL